MASNAMSAANLGCWIPEYQSGKSLVALQKRLVLQNVITMDWRDQIAWGDTLNIPILPDQGDAQDVSLTADLTLNVSSTAKKSIVINQQKYKAVGVGYNEQLLNRPDYLTEIATKCTYSVAKQIDKYAGSFFSSLTAGNVGTQGVALDDDALMTGKENLDTADADEDDRHLVLDVQSITDLLKIDKMVRDDYVARGAVEAPSRGLIGRSRYGAMVWQSNNLTVANSNYHYAAFLQIEAIGMILLRNTNIRMFDWEEKHTNVVEAMALYGAAVLRPTAGVCINTRS